MIYDFILTNKAGYNLEEAIEDTNVKNAVIKVMEYGVVKDYSPANPYTLKRWENIIQIDPRYFFIKEKTVTDKGIKRIDKPMIEGKLAIGVNPYWQLFILAISREIDERESKFSVPFENIARTMIMEYRVLPHIRGAYSFLRQGLKRMNKLHLILLHGNEYALGIPLTAEDRLVDFVPGFDPYEHQVMYHLERKGTVSVNESIENIMNVLKWTKYPSTVIDYIKKLCKQKNIKRRGHMLDYQNPLVENTIKS